ncbi:hypothetical protein [Komagataeibacter swingsii]|nr:hypothetical protein [Komagataeibacter swingsii]
MPLPLRRQGITRRAHAPMPRRRMPVPQASRIRHPASGIRHGP